MKLQPTNPPRTFEVGRRPVTISDSGTLELDPDEQITLTTPDGGEYDVARKSFGFYATPSLNDRLPRFGLRPALVRNADASYYLLLVESSRMDEFEAYCGEEAQELVGWLDDEATLERIANAAAAV
ncbi:MAG: hypothetical protein ACR2K6_08285 [Solirubrobacterales bacterium]